MVVLRVEHCGASELETRVVGREASIENKRKGAKEMKRSLGMVLAVSWVVGTAVPVSAEHPFVLVNVIDLFDMHGLQVPVESTGDCDVQPSNTPLAVSEMRVGTNPSAVATDGTRVWIGGYYGGNGFLAGAWR